MHGALSTPFTAPHVHGALSTPFTAPHVHGTLSTPFTAPHVHGHSHRHINGTNGTIRHLISILFDTHSLDYTISRAHHKNLLCCPHSLATLFLYVLNNTHFPAYTTSLLNQPLLLYRLWTKTGVSQTSHVCSHQFQLRNNHLSYHPLPPTCTLNNNFDITTRHYETQEEETTHLHAHLPDTRLSIYIKTLHCMLSTISFQLHTTLRNNCHITPITLSQPCTAGLC